MGCRQSPNRVVQWQSIIYIENVIINSLVLSSIFIHERSRRKFASYAVISLHKWPRIWSTCCKYLPVLSALMAYHPGCIYINTTGATNGAETVYHSWAHDFTPGYQWGSYYSLFSICVCFVDRCLSFCAFSIGHCVVCSSSIYGFWLPLWYLQTTSFLRYSQHNIKR